MRYERISLPKDLADQLVAEGTAVYPIATRGDGVLAAMEFALDAVNTGASVVTVGVAAGTLRKLAKAALRRRSADDPNVVVISVTSRGEVKSISIDRSHPGSEDQAFDFFAKALGVD